MAVAKSLYPPARLDAPKFVGRWIEMPSCLDERAPGVPTSELVKREKLVEAAGYRYHLIRCCFVNRPVRRVFSIEFVENHTREELQRLIDAPPADDWVFHFNEGPAESVRRKLIEDFDK